jgi:hypothetical protein
MGYCFGLSGYTDSQTHGRDEADGLQLVYWYRSYQRLQRQSARNDNHLAVEQDNRRGYERMQQIDVGIVPGVLTNDELLRLANHYIQLGTLPKNWQLELVSRFSELLDRLDELHVE